MAIDIMLDLETTGTAPGCGILSIGACSLDLQHTFYRKINNNSCQFHGLKNDYQTMAWWMKQEGSARREAFSGTAELMVALGDFSDWFRKITKEAKYVWGNGADFDVPILRAAYEVTDMSSPIGPFNARCYRTMKNYHKDVKMPDFEGMKHNALDDAKMQALHLKEILKKYPTSF